MKFNSIFGDLRDKRMKPSIAYVSPLHLIKYNLVENRLKTSFDCFSVIFDHFRTTDLKKIV